MIVTLKDGSKFDVQVVDPTHVTMTLVGGTTGVGWAYHVQQLSSEVVQQLQDGGVMDDRLYVSRGVKP